MSIPKTGTYSLYGMINELPPIKDTIENVIRSTANSGRLVPEPEDFEILHPNGDRSYELRNGVWTTCIWSEAERNKYNFSTHGHFSYRQWLKYLETFPKYKEFMTFSFVRNPYDRMVSIYKGHYEGGANDHEAAWSHSDNSRSFKTFCEYNIELEPDHPPFESDNTPILHFKNHLLDRFQTQTYYLTGNNGQIGVDFVGMLENLKEDYEKLRELNQVYSGALLPKFDERYHLNSSKRDKNYEEYYTEELKEKIYSIFKEDFINFGYKR